MAGIVHGAVARAKCGGAAQVAKCSGGAGGEVRRGSGGGEKRGPGSGPAFLKARGGAMACGRGWGGAESGRDTAGVGAIVVAVVSRSGAQGWRRVGWAVARPGSWAGPVRRRGFFLNIFPTNKINKNL